MNLSGQRLLDKAFISGPVSRRACGWVSRFSSGGGIPQLARQPWAGVGLPWVTSISSPLLGSVGSPGRDGWLRQWLRFEPRGLSQDWESCLPLAGYSCFGGGAQVFACAIKHEIGKFCV